MDTVYQPSFIFSQNRTLITNRFVEFRKLCELFANEIIKGRDPSAMILTKITKFPSLRDVPLLNEAFDLLKDSAFEYHISHEKGNLVYWPEDDPQNDQGDLNRSNSSFFFHH